MHADILIQEQVFPRPNGPLLGLATRPPQIPSEQTGLALHTAVVLGRPLGLGGGGKRGREVHVDGQLDRPHRSRVPGQPGVTGPRPRHDPHHRPVAGSEDPGEGGFIDRTRPRTVSRMGVQPDPGEFRRLSTEIDLLLEVVGDGGVRELHGHHRRHLWQQHHIGHLAS